MSTTPRFAVSAAIALCAALPTPARAQLDPKFEYAKVDEKAPPIEWHVMVKAGGMVTTGNSQNLTLNLGGLVTRRDLKNKVSFEASYIYVESKAPGVDDRMDADKLIQDNEFFRTTSVTTNNWLVKGRYDRFFTTNNSAYVSAYVSGDEPAGKALVGGAQLGYARQLYKTEMHELVTELGADYSFENYVGRDDRTDIFSGRAFFGYQLKLAEKAGVYANVEVLDNFNEESAPWSDGTYEADPGRPGHLRPQQKVPVFADVRCVGKVGLTATLWKNLSVGLGFTVKYDAAPAPRAKIGGFAFDPEAKAFFVEKVDTITEANLIVNFL